METPLLATKLVVPPVRPGLVARPRLMERLGGGLSSSLILVSAPAGFGKTTLLSEWVHSSHLKEHTAWVSLDEADNDPVHFWDYFIAALQTLHPGCGDKILPWLHSSRPPSAESILTVVINDLSRVDKHDCVVVLDDYHLIVSKQIHDGITYMVEHLPDRVHLAIAARADPPLPLPRFRGKGTMLEIRTDDLRFTRDDAGSLLQALKAPEISANDIAALNDRTEGWAVGLKMAALSMSGQKDIPGFIAAFAGSQRYVMDYLVEEVLEKQLPHVQDFLLKTSILERMTGPLCDAVTERTGGREMLLRLERDNLFLVPLDDSMEWYRYHHLFADVLRHRLKVENGEELVSALHSQASGWYEDSGLFHEAIQHAQAAQDWARSMRLIYAQWEACRKRGEFKTLLGWFQVVPAETLRGHLPLYSKYANLLARAGRLEEAEAALAYLEPVVGDNTALRGEISLAMGFICQYRGDQKRYLELTEEAFALMPPDDVSMLGWAAERIAHARQRLGLLAEAEEWAMKAYELGIQAGDIWAAMNAREQMGIVAACRGKLNRAVALLENDIELGGQAPPAHGPRDILCLIQYLLNDLDGAAESARLTVEWSELSGQTMVGIPAFSCLVQVCQARGDPTGAAAAMQELDQVVRHPTDSMWYASYLASHVAYAMRKGDLEEAVRWGQRLPATAGIMPIDRHIPALLLLARGKKQDAALLLREIHDGFARVGADGLVARTRIYQALAADNEASALEFLSEALRAMEPEGVIRPFVDEGKLLSPLLQMALVHGVTPAFTRKLLDIIDEEERWKRATKGAMPPLPLACPLSQREIEVMKLVAEGLSNQQIADRLSISLSTAKTHVYHIFDKLGAKDRLQAVSIAKEITVI